MFSIGEFSRITGLTVKTLRFYQEKGVLAPSYVNPATGYRYYNGADAERARAIRRLRELDFSLEDIALIIGQEEDEATFLDLMERRREALRARMSADRKKAAALDRMIKEESEATAMATQAMVQIEEKDLPAMLIAGIRMRGKYSDCGKGFAQLGRKLGRFIQGKPFNLYYDAEYKEADADFEACFPIRMRREAEGISIRELPAARCVSLIHKGPYEELGRSYEKVLAYVKQKNLRTQLPSREVYLKGPGMIFRGNPKNYLTEIQIILESDAMT